jgi:hypothetical protein
LGRPTIATIGLLTLKLLSVTNCPENKIEKRREPSSLLAFIYLLGVSRSHDLKSAVGTAILASPVGKNGLAALGALGNVGKVELPVGAAPLISSLTGNFTLGYCHDFRLLTL